MVRSHATRLKGTPYTGFEKSIHTTNDLVKKLQDSTEKYVFRAHLFQTTELGKKRVVEAINTAMKKELEHDHIVRECASQKLTVEEKAFVLNFLVYWKELEKQPEFRESPKQMVDYLFKESIAHLQQTGKVSYCISLLSNDGSPAGMLLGALLHPYVLLTNNGVTMDKARGQDLINFYQYISVPEKYRGLYAADVLCKEAEHFVEQNTMRSSSIIIAQVDKTNPVYDDEVKLKTLIHEIPGLRHFEMIPDEGKVYAKQTVFPPASKQGPLTLRVDTQDGEKSLSRNLVEDMVKALVSYYDVYPGHVIAGTKKDAFDAYVQYHLKNVKYDNGQVKLEYAP